MIKIERINRRRRTRQRRLVKRVSPEAARDTISALCYHRLSVPEQPEPGQTVISEIRSGIGFDAIRVEPWSSASSREGMKL